MANTLKCDPVLERLWERLHPTQGRTFQLADLLSEFRWPSLRGGWPIFPPVSFVPEISFQPKERVGEVKVSKFLYLSIESVIQPDTDDHKMLRLPCGRGVTTMLIRQDYIGFLKLLLMLEPRIEERNIIISGHPGIGKSWFLTFLLVYRIMLGLPTIWQTDKLTYHKFTTKGLTIHHLYEQISDPDKLDPKVWALMDESPGTGDHYNQWFFIHASSPQPGQIKWRKQRNAQVYYMSPWTWAEVLVSLSINPNTEGITEDDTRVYQYWLVYNLFGPVPRLCMESLKPQIYSWQSKVATYANNLSKIIKTLVSATQLSFLSPDLDGNLSHQLILLKPAPEDSDIEGLEAGVGNQPIPQLEFVGNIPESWELDGWLRVIKSSEPSRTMISTFVEHLFVEGLRKATENERWRAFSYFNSLNATKSMAGKVFEVSVHNFFSAERTVTIQSFGQPSSPKPKDASQPLTIIIKSTTTGNPSLIFQNLESLSTLLRQSRGSRAINGAIFNSYIRPIASNFPTADSLTIAARVKIPTAGGQGGSEGGMGYILVEPCVVLFQITVASDHGIEIGGLNRLSEALPKAKASITYEVPGVSMGPNQRRTGTTGRKHDRSDDFGSLIGSKRKKEELTLQHERVPWLLVWITPDHAAGIIKKPQQLNPSDHRDKKFWDGKLLQHSLRLSKEALLR